MVGTQPGAHSRGRWLCPPYGLNWCDISSNGIVIHGLPTLPRDGKSAEYFSRNRGERVFHGSARRHAFAVKKPRLAARKIACLQFAARLASAVNVRRGAFWRTGFKLLTRLGISHRAAPTSFAARFGTPHKCFNQHRIFDTTRRRAAPCGLNACSGAVFRKHRRAYGRGLPSVCRKAPEVRRKTRHLRAARLTMQLKCFSRQPICHPAKSNFFVIASQRVARMRAR